MKCGAVKVLLILLLESEDALSANPIKSLLSVVRHPGNWVRFQPYSTRKNYNAFKRVVLKPQLSHRQSLYMKNKQIASDVIIPVDKGFVSYGPETTNWISPKLIEWCENKAKEKIAALDLDQNHKKNYLINLLEGEELDLENEAFQFATHPEIVSAATKYLDAYPLLTYIGLWYTPANKDTMMAGSQLFHLDHEDFKQVKGFVYLNDMSADSGAQMIIDAQKSLELQRKINYTMTESSKRVPDEVINEYDPQHLDAKKGSLVMMDTSSCFHAGGRTQKRDRLLLTFQYVTPYRHAKTRHTKRYENFSESIGDERLKYLLKA